MSIEQIPYSFFSDKFKKKKEQYEMPDQKTLDFLTEKVSPEYAAFIAQEGFCMYKDGLFSTINPLKYAEATTRFGVHPAHAVPLVKSAFGDLFYYNGIHNTVLHVSFNSHGNIGEGSAVKYLFVFQLTDAGFHKSFFSKKTIFKKALEKHGKLKADESYGFTPLVPAGGAEKFENTTIVKTLDYLKALASHF